MHCPRGAGAEPFKGLTHFRPLTRGSGWRGDAGGRRPGLNLPKACPRAVRSQRHRAQQERREASFLRQSCPRHALLRGLSGGGEDEAESSPPPTPKRAQHPRAASANTCSCCPAWTLRGLRANRSCQIAGAGLGAGLAPVRAGTSPKQAETRFQSCLRGREVGWDTLTALKGCRDS